MATSHSGAHIFVESCKHASHIVLQLVEHVHGSALKMTASGVLCVMLVLHCIMISLTCMYTCMCAKWHIHVHVL